MSNHWVAEQNDNYSDDPLCGWVVRYDPTPGGKKREDGSTVHSLTFPAFAITAWVSEPEAAASNIAEALNNDVAVREENKRLKHALELAAQSSEFHYMTFETREAISAALEDRRP